MCQFIKKTKYRVFLSVPMLFIKSLNIISFLERINPRCNFWRFDSTFIWHPLNNCNALHIVNRKFMIIAYNYLNICFFIISNSYSKLFWFFWKIKWFSSKKSDQFYFKSFAHRNVGQDLIWSQWSLVVFNVM